MNKLIGALCITIVMAACGDTIVQPPQTLLLQDTVTVTVKDTVVVPVSWVGPRIYGLLWKTDGDGFVLEGELYGVPTVRVAAAGGCQNDFNVALLDNIGLDRWYTISSSGEIKQHNWNQLHHPSNQPAVQYLIRLAYNSPLVDVTDFYGASFLMAGDVMYQLPENHESVMRSFCPSLGE